MTEPALGRKISVGRRADVYEWQPGWVVKLYRKGIPNEEGERELRGLIEAARLGVRVPAAKGLIQVDSRTGLLMETVAGRNVLEVLQKSPWRVTQYARRIALLQLAIHEHTSNLPSLKDNLGERILRAPGLSEAEREQLIQKLEDLPDDRKLCHGDLNLVNLIDHESQLCVLDWEAAASGNPLADVARSVILIQFWKSRSPVLGNVFWTIYLRAYLNAYFEGQREKLAEFRRWLPIVAAARVAEGVEEQNPRLLSAVRRWLREQA